MANDKYILRIIDGHYNSEDLNQVMGPSINVDIVGGKIQALALLATINELSEKAKKPMTLVLVREEVSVGDNGDCYVHYENLENVKTCINVK